MRFLFRVRCWEYRQMAGVVRLTRPSRPDKARRLGYKAKQARNKYQDRLHCWGMLKLDVGLFAGLCHLSLSCSPWWSQATCAQGTSIASEAAPCKTSSLAADLTPCFHSTGYRLWKALQPRYHSAQAYSQLEVRCRGARWAKGRRPSRPQLLLGERSEHRFDRAIRP